MTRALAKSLALLAALLALAGCGLAETGATAAAGGASAAQQAKQAQDTEAQVRQQVNAAYQEDAARRTSRVQPGLAAEAQAQ